MLHMAQSRKGEFQEVDHGDYFTFGDLEDCPDSSLKNWAKEQSWYDPGIDFSFIDFSFIDGWVSKSYRIALVKQTVAYVYTYNTPNRTESYKDWEKWKIKNHVIYK